MQKPQGYIFLLIFMDLTVLGIGALFLTKPKYLFLFQEIQF